MRVKKILSLCVMLAGLSACLGSEAPSDQFYALNPDLSALSPAAKPTLDGVLEVQRVGSDGVFVGRPILFARSKGAGLEEYPYSLWTKRPSQLIEEALVSALRDSNLARTVVDERHRLSADYVLISDLREINRVLDGAGEVVIALELGLKRVADNKLLVLKTYRVQKAQADSSMEAAIGAFNSALGEIFTKFINDINAGA